MMKSSTLFERGPLPPYVHLASTRRHSRDRCSQAFPVFRALPLPCIILNANRRTKNGGGLGTRLVATVQISFCRTFNETMWSLTDGRRRWKTKLSSAGLVYFHFGHRVIAKITGKSLFHNDVNFVVIQILHAALHFE